MSLHFEESFKRRAYIYICNNIRNSILRSDVAIFIELRVRRLNEIKIQEFLEFRRL